MEAAAYFLHNSLNVAASLREGATLQRFAYPEFQAAGVELNETTMIDSRHAELHLVFRYHGELLPGLVGQATHTFNGACVYDGPIADADPIYGTPGPNTCWDPFCRSTTSSTSDRLFM